MAHCTGGSGSGSIGGWPDAPRGSVVSIPAGHRRRRPCEHETSGDRARGRDGLFASLALIPFTLAFGRCLGTSSTGPHEAASAKIEDTIVQLMTVILGPELVGDVAAPYVRAQLSQARGGLWS
jgi:hypothetical protein